MINQHAYPFADIDLARRLERVEARSNANFIEARARAFPARGAMWIEVAGAYAMFDGAGSPVTQSFGLGMSEPITPTHLDTLEEFFGSRGAESFHEVCPLADASVFQLFHERHYRPVEFSNVLYRPVSVDLRLAPQRSAAINVRVVGKNEVDVWAQTMSEGWSEFVEVADFMREINEVMAQSDSLLFLAELEGQPVAAGAMTIAGDVALLAGASTIPAARRQGAQLALLEERLRYAATQGCSVGMMVTLPGSGSQRNAERHGFRIAYTRTKWGLDHAGL